MVTRSAAKKSDPEYSVRFLIAAAGNATMAQSPAVVRAGAELLGCHTLPICNDLRLHFPLATLYCHAPPNPQFANRYVFDSCLRNVCGG